MNLFSFLLLMIFGDLVTSKDPPTQIIIIESSTSGVCKHFNYNDIKILISRPKYEQVTKVLLLPTAHLIEKKANDGSIYYEHRFGDDGLKLAYAQFCANQIYFNDRALKWANYVSNKNVDLKDSLRKFFSEDKGKAMLSCTFGEEAIKITTKYIAIARKYKFGGVLPFIINVAKNELLPQNNSNLSFIDRVCEIRADKKKLEACQRVSIQEYIRLFQTEYYIPENYELSNIPEKDKLLLINNRVNGNDSKSINWNLPKEYIDKSDYSTFRKSNDERVPNDLLKNPENTIDRNNKLINIEKDEDEAVISSIQRVIINNLR